MDLFQAIEERRSIRKFKPDLVNENDLKEIIRAGTLAPNAENGQMWYFVGVMNQEIIKKVSDAVITRVDMLINALKTLGQEKEISNHRYFLEFFKDAPAFIAVFCKDFDNALDQALHKIDMKLKTPVIIDSNQQSIGAAVENISLAAHAKGYGTTWMYGPVLAFKEIGEILGMDSSWVLSALLPIGVPIQYPKARPRKPLEEVSKIIK